MAEHQIILRSNGSELQPLVVGLFDYAHLRRPVKMNERGQVMRVPDNFLNDEDKWIAKRGRRRMFSLMIYSVLSNIGLLLYLKIAPQPNLMLIEIWFAGTGAALGLGITTITGHLDRTLPRHQVSDDVNDRTTDSNSGLARLVLTGYHGRLDHCLSSQAKGRSFPRVLMITLRQ